MRVYVTKGSLFALSSAFMLIDIWMFKIVSVFALHLFSFYSQLVALGLGKHQFIDSRTP